LRRYATPPPNNLATPISPPPKEEFSRRAAAAAAETFDSARHGVTEIFKCNSLILSYRLKKKSRKLGWVIFLKIKSQKLRFHSAAPSRNGISQKIISNCEPFASLE